MWDDYMGWDFYAVRQYLFFAGIIFAFASLVSLTEGHPWHYPVSYIVDYLMSHSTAVLIIAIVLSIGAFRFIMFKEGY